jgi:hypothetical protein
VGSPLVLPDPNHTYVIEDGLENWHGPEQHAIFWRLNRSGLFYYRTEMSPASLTTENGGELCILDFENAAIQIAKSIFHLPRLYERLLSPRDEVWFVLVLVGTRNRMLVPRGTSGDYVCQISEITVERRKSIAEWRDGLVDHAVEMAKEVYVRFNLFAPDLDLARKAIERALPHDITG